VSDPTSIFEKNQEQETPVETNTNGVAPAPANDDLTTMLGAIKNERGEQKYRSIQDALNALKHSQEYIPELSTKLAQQENELKVARETANKVAELERLVQNLSQEKPQNEQPSQQGLSEEQVAELVTRTLTKRQQEDLLNANISSVANKVKQAYGEKAEEVFYGKAQELGMTKEQFNTLAASTPKAVMKLLGIEDKAPVEQFKPSVGSVNTTGIQPRQDTYIGRNREKLEVGATNQELMREAASAKKMVEELAAKGMTIDDLTKPSNYYKFFN